MTQEFAKTLQPFILDGMEYHANACIDGVLINPLLPDRFDVTPNDERTDDDIALWWGRPYIQVEDWRSQEIHVRGNQQRLRREGSEYAVPLADVDALVEGHRKAWFEGWPTGSRFSVRCLDGGAWDRSTNWGMFATLEEAFECVANGPAWRRLPA